MKHTIGDKVKITKTGSRSGDWKSNRDKYEGQEVVIEGIENPDSKGIISYRVSGSEYWWWGEWLEKVIVHKWDNTRKLIL